MSATVTPSTDSRNNNCHCDCNYNINKNNNNDDDCCWYFAIGSMINPTSLMLRDLHPLESHPAMIHDFELIFSGMLLL